MVSGDETTRTEKLLQAVSEGDEAALNRLIEMHREYLRRVVELRMDQALRGRVDPSDIVQETQVVANKRMQEFLRWNCPRKVDSGPILTGR